MKGERDMVEMWVNGKQKEVNELEQVIAAMKKRNLLLQAARNKQIVKKPKGFKDISPYLGAAGIIILIFVLLMWIL